MKLTWMYSRRPPGRAAPTLVYPEIHPQRVYLPFSESYTTETESGMHRRLDRYLALWILLFASTSRICSLQLTGSRVRRGQCAVLLRGRGVSWARLSTYPSTRISITSLEKDATISPPRLSIRNTDLDLPMTLTSVQYFSSEGALVEGISHTTTATRSLGLGRLRCE